MTLKSVIVEKALRVFINLVLEYVAHLSSIISYITIHVMVVSNSKMSLGNESLCKLISHLIIGELLTQL